MSAHIFGIRHHGPGSARSLARALEALQPDAVLVEGPPDADDVLPLLAHAGMQPPVALLVYAPEDLRRAAFYPFAAFSPEYRAIRYALDRGVPVRFMDLPQAHLLAGEGAEGGGQRAEAEAERGETAEPSAAEGGANEESDPHPASRIPHPSRDPLGALAEAAGFSDGERWWEHVVEQRRDGADQFAAVLEAMAALREGTPAAADPVELRREAWMRRTIRGALAEGFRRIAVVCGAWHGPALGDLADEAGDAALLLRLPTIATAATWVPWTYGRLSMASGYGAGVASPGWYDHLWHHPGDPLPHWMTRVARLLREEGLDASSAHVIEAVRLAEALAGLRDMPLPGLPELNEACRAIFCFGSDLPMRLIENRLVVGERMGTVPDETPMVPLQQDLRREQRRLRLEPSADWKDIELDLRNTRNDLDRARSFLLRRLNLLGVAWGRLEAAAAGMGTSKERWRIQWSPELDVALIEAAPWGNTIADAATARAADAAAQQTDLPPLVRLVNQSLLADLPGAVAGLMARLEERAALTSDVAQLMDALCEEDRATRVSLAYTLRYGDQVRRTDAAALARVVEGMVARICVGLPNACAALNDDAAQAMFGRIVGVDAALHTLNDAAQLASWHAALRRVADLSVAHGLVAGRCCRILLDAQALDADEAAGRVGRSLSPGTPPAQGAAWVEGLLRDGAALLLADDRLWRILDAWVAELPADMFQQTLPLLRRTFGTFTEPERRRMGERARRDAGPRTASDQGGEGRQGFDDARAEAVLPLVALLLGVADE